MTRIRSVAALLGVFTVFACGGSGEIGVMAQLEGEDGADATPLAELEIRAIPYDRDAVFDSLRDAAAAAGNPEPAIPDSIMQMQSEIAAANEAWSVANAQWSAARDSLRSIQTAMDRLSRTSAEYRLLFGDFNDQEAVASAAERRSNAAFAEFEALQGRFTNLAQELGIVRSQWADDAYAAVDTIFPLLLELSGREILADTTDANGGALFTSVPAGQWWIHARYELPFEELYWNIPIEVVGGEIREVVLNRASAESRPLF